MNEHRRTLLDDLDEAPVGAAPVGHLLTGGQAAKRRKQRAFVAGAAAVTALVVGGSALALQGIPGGSDDRDSNDPLIADSAAPDLAVEVEVGVAKPLAAMIDGQDGKVAIWNPGDRTLAFVPERGYSSSCPPSGTAKFTDAETVTLTVRNDPAPGPCTADDQPITVTIDGLTTAPPELTVTIQGETDTIPVKSATDDRAPDREDSEKSFDPGRSRVAHLFLDFARREGEADGPPVDTPVALYLGNAYQRTIPDGKSDRRGQWRVCDDYGQHACPMSALEVLVGSQGEVVIGDSVTSACLETLAEPPSETGGPHQVVLSPPEPRTCSDDYAVQIWINDVGQITALNLLLGSDS